MTPRSAILSRCPRSRSSSKGHITSWFQLRNKLLSSFKVMQVEELDSNDLVNMCIQGDKESLQEYMHRVVKLTVRAWGV
jgi:hypothetical protein